MENCLVTKLLSVVDNDHLKPLLGYTIDVKSADLNGDYLKLNVSGNSDITVTARGSGHVAASIAELTTDPKTTVSGSRLTVFLSNDSDYFVDISGMLTSFEFEIVAPTGEAVSYNRPTVNAFDIGQLEIAVPSLNTIRCLKSAFGNISTLKETATTMFYLAFCNVVGSVTDIPQITDKVYIHNTPISGTIEDFVTSRERMTQLSMIFNVTSTNVTFGGAVRATQSIMWDRNNGTIACGDKSSISSSTRIYCSGYTQEQAEAAFSGKTIVRVDA